ncbi:MAG: hypothetical protein V1782_09885 [Pseudomonadota bacterium]
MKNTFDKSELIVGIVKYWEDMKSANFEGYDRLEDKDENNIFESAKDTADLIINAIISQLYYYLARDFVAHSPAWQPCLARKHSFTYHYLAPANG